MAALDVILIAVLTVSVFIGCFKLALDLRRSGTKVAGPLILSLSGLVLLLVSKLCDLQSKHSAGGRQVWEDASWLLFLCGLPILLVGLRKYSRGK